MDAIDEFWRTSINQMESQELRSAIGTPLKLMESVWLVTQFCLRDTETEFLEVENLAVNVLLGTSVIGHNVD